MGALAAELYQMPLYGFIEHLRTVRERYGDPAARLEVRFALEVRQARAELAKKAQG